MKPQDIKKVLDTVVTEYVEGKIGIGQVSKSLSRLATGEVYKTLNESNMGHIASMIDIIADIDYLLSQDAFNHHDPGNVLSVIDDYYNKIKA